MPNVRSVMLFLGSLMESLDFFHLDMRHAAYVLHAMHDEIRICLEQNFTLGAMARKLLHLRSALPDRLNGVIHITTKLVPVASGRECVLLEHMTGFVFCDLLG